MIKNKYTGILSGFLHCCAVALAFSCAPSGNVSYDVVRNYFFRNDASVPTSPKINSQEQFDSLFGAAAFMGKDGRPTSVDFGRQFVIAVVLPETDIETTLEPLSLTRSGGKLTFTYVKKEGEKVSYTMRPVLLVAVDRADETDEVVLKCN